MARTLFCTLSVACPLFRLRHCQPVTALRAFNNLAGQLITAHQLLSTLSTIELHHTLLVINI
jgi:hypothetical protein